jgi:tetratricopeptide (TPR) repeat protein
MSAKTIKSALGRLQDDPENDQAWSELRADVVRDPGMSPGELAALLQAARQAHEARRDFDAVAHQLEIEVAAAAASPSEGDLLAELARVLDDELLDDDRARGAYERLLEVNPDHSAAAEALERSAAKRARWRDLAARYLDEAKGAADPTFRSALLVTGAEVIYRYGRTPGEHDVATRILNLLRDALALDPKNRRGQMLLERVLRAESRAEDAAAAIERYAGEAVSRDEKVAAWVRLARLYAKKLGAPQRAVAAYERVIDLSPGHAEAASFLSDFFTSSEMWDHLVALYEGQLSAGALRGKEEESGAIVQIAMVLWRMGGKPDAAEPWFEKLRKLEPAHPGMLSYFRERCTARGETARLAAILTDASRSVSEGPERTALGAEIAKLAEGGANAQKAIEQWRSLLRQDPRNREAREALKRLYRQTASYSALTDLLRQELEKLPADDAAGRLPILREIAAVYGDHVKSDSALVTVLTQIVQLDPTDLPTVRELVRVYEALQRWRDLLATQARQADLEPDASVKAELWRAIARRWLDQFSNVQNATEAYEKLRALEPGDREALERLRELYVKRRAYKPLFDLLLKDAETKSGDDRRALWMEAAKLAAERLDLGAEAVALYKKVLAEDPTSAAALDAIEKQAERDKDFATVAEVLERRAEVAGDAAARLAVLQKLGTIYSERLHDQARAMSAWRRVLAAQPGHPKALRVLRDGYLAAADYDGLTALYAESGDWEGLAEVISGAADRATDAGVKVDLSWRSAAIYKEKLSAPERAFRAYERILSVRPDDERAARALLPLYEADEKWGRLPALYEILLGHARDLDTKLELLAKLVRTTAGKLQDRAAAFSFARQAYEMAPDRAGALEAFEAAARAAEEWPGFVEALSARLAAIDAAGVPARGGKKKKKKDEDAAADASSLRDERRALRAKLADVYAQEMGRLDEAVQAYRGLIEEDDGDEEAVLALDRLLREADRRDDLRWLLELRVERANTAHRLDLLSEWAMLEEDAFASPDRAVALYRRILQIVPQHGRALRALARLLRAQGDAAGAVEVLAVDRDLREGAERAAREVELASLYAEPLHRYADAMAASERALALAPNDPGAVAVIEGLLRVGETRARAASLLERVYDETGAAGRQAEVLEVLVVTTAAHRDRLALYARLIDVHEHKLDAPDAAFDVAARAAAQFPAELSLWDRLAALAARTNRVQALVDALAAAVPVEGSTGLPEAVEIELADRAAALYADRLGEIDRARPYLERMLARDPGHERAFLRLKQLLTAREQWGDLLGMYERAVGAQPDPERRADLLGEVALIAEDVIGDRGKAIGYYERVLELFPLHERAVRALDTLYAGEGRYDRLAALLERRIAAATGDERLDLAERLGLLLQQRLADPSAALSHLEVVLRERPNAAEARRVVESILDVAELRLRAATVLEEVYAARDDVPDLVRALEIHLEFARGADERRDLLRRVAELRDERLRDDAGALDAYARLMPLDPDDAGARRRLLEIGRRLGADERCAQVLTATAAAAAVPMPRAEILMEAASLYREPLGDTARAEQAYRQVLELAPQDASIALPACRALEAIYAPGDPARLRDILRIEIGLEEDAAARRALRGRLGELCETVLNDPAGAVQAYKARLDDDPVDAEALLALDRLYERLGAWRELVEVRRARERLTDDREARRELLVRIAATLADRLADVDEAILAYRAVIDDFGADRASLASLASLYQLADRWRDLAETLEADLGLAEAPADKFAVLSRLGEVRRKHLGDVAGAIEAYRQALEIEPGNAGCRAALEAMLDDPAARRDAAAILRPLYEADGLSERLLRVLDIEAENASSLPEKLVVIAQAARVAESAMSDPARAFEYVSRGLREAVADPELREWIERAERLTASTGRYADLVALLRSVAGDILDGDLQLEVTLRVAEIGRTHLSDPALAKEYYTRALELRGDDQRVLGALESLYEQLADYPALLDVLKRRAEAAPDDVERKRLLFKQGRLSDERLRDLRGAIAVYEQILDLGLDPEAVQALEGLYARAERWEDLVALYERQLGTAGTSNERKATLHHALAEVLEKRTREIDRAFDEYAAALEIDPKHPQTVASLEALMTRPETSARAAAMLEPVYQARLDWRRVMATLEARLAVGGEREERRELLARLAKLHEEQEENSLAALETMALLLAEDPTDESTWAELERLARFAGAEARLAAVFAGELEKITSDEPATARLSRRTGELFEAQGDVERALAFHRRAYAFEPEAGEESFRAIDRLLTRAGRPADRVALYRGALDYKNDAQERIAALHTIAEIEERELGDHAAAVETLRAALDVDDADPRTLAELARLYAKGERYKDLADLTRRRAEQSALPEDEVPHRLELARLLVHRLGDVEAGLDELQIVIDLSPPGPGRPGAQAVEELEKLLASPEHKSRVVDMLRPIYERADDWQKLVAIGQERLALASDDADRITVLREIAELWERRGGDLGRAFDAMRAAWALDPEDGDAREQLDRLAGVTGRWEDLARAYEGAAQKTDGLTRRELWSALAGLYDKKLDDPRRALSAYGQLFELDETDLQPLEEMDALATMVGDWPALVRVLTKKAELVPDDETRASTWRRVGEAKRDMLDDRDGAVDAYERALELEPTSTLTLDALIELYEQKNVAGRLVDLYRRRVELCGEDDAALSFRLLVDAARRLDVDLTEPAQAIDCLRQAQALRPEDPEVLERLDALYGRERMWPDLLEVLKTRVAGAADDVARRSLLKRIAALYAGELQDPASAIQTYREVLSAGLDDVAAAAILKLGEAHDDLRAEAADALEPVLRAAARYADLVAALRLRLRAQTEARERAVTLRAIAEVSERDLGDADAAQAALLEALPEEPQDAALHGDIERLSERLGAHGWRRYAETLEGIAPNVFDAAVAGDVLVRLGRAAEEKLDDAPRAASAYVAAAERGGDDPGVLRALDRLFTRLGDDRRLADVLERRVGTEADPGVQADALHRLGVLQVRRFGERAQGLATLRRALDLVPDHAPSRQEIETLLDDDALFDEAFEALEQIHRSLGHSEDLARLYERRVVRAAEVPDRVRARLDLAKVLAEVVGDGTRAQTAVQAAVTEDPADEDALAELERLAAANRAWGEAADAFGAALEAAQDLPAETRTQLWCRLAAWRRDHLDDGRRAEQAFEKALAVDPENVEVLRSLEALRRAPGRERDLVQTLRRRAQLEPEIDAKRELFREAEGLAEGPVGDRELAEGILRDLLAEDSGDLWALGKLTELRRSARDHAEVVKLLLARAEIVPDGAEAARLKHEAAGVLADDLRDSTRAAALYEEILEADPSDATASSALRAMYGREGRDRDLARLLERLVDVAVTPADRTQLRLELAVLQGEKLGAADEAIGTLRAILDEEPSHGGALVALSTLYERSGRDQDLADLLASQADAARDRNDAAAELSVRLRLAQIQEENLQEPAQALQTYEQVIERDPHHKGALQAVARIAERRGEWERAAGALAGLLELASDPSGVPLALRLAEAREKAGDGAGAEDALRRGLALEPANTGLRSTLRARWEKAGRWAELAELLVGDADLIASGQIAVESRPSARASIAPLAKPAASSQPPPASPAVAEQVRVLRAAAEIHLKKRTSPEDAIPLLERASQLVPTDRDLLSALCEAYGQAGRARDAAVVLERIIASFGTRRTKELATYHHRLSGELVLLGDKTAALAQLDTAFKIDPGSIGVLRDLGVLAYETGDMDRAQKTFRALLLQRLDGAAGITKGEVFFYLGEISALQGDRGKAAQMLERALENEPTLERARARLAELKA